MSFVPIQIPVRALRQADVSVSILRRSGTEFVDFRFARGIHKAAGWHRYDRVAPFVDFTAGHLMLATAGATESAARALTYQGGQQLSVRWARLAPFDSIFPANMPRTSLPVIRAGEGQVVLDLTQIVRTSQPPVPQPPQPVFES